MQSNRHYSSRRNATRRSKSTQNAGVPTFQSLESRRLMSLTVPALSSRPAAYEKLYIDFDGDYTASWGSYSPGTTPAYDTDGNPYDFSAGELSNIQQIWARVAEKYSPFNIDVTTVNPGNLNDGQTMRIVVGGSGAWCGGAGGLTWIGGFKNSMPNTGYVFSNNLAGGDPKYTAEAVSHEAGHGFGLNHQSVYSGSSLSNAYNPGNGATAPVMGNSYAATRGLWWYGQSSTGYSTYQDDLSVLGNAIGYRPDDVGNSVWAASPMSVSGSVATSSGVIENTSDTDYYSFYTGGGNVSFTVNPSSFGGMLDPKLSLVNSSGSVIASSDWGLSETVSAYVGAGTYYVVVGSHGSYGDVGQYSVTGTIGSGGNSTITTTPPPTTTVTNTTYAPSAPSGLSATATSSSQVSLSWYDNSSNETGFKIERNTDYGSWQTIATLGANVTAYVDSGLTASTNYVYRVRATNAAGDSGATSDTWVTTRSGSSTTTNTTTTTTTTTNSNTGTSTGTKLTGTAFGTAGSWTGNNYSNAFDGNTNTYFDSDQADNAVAGLDLGSPQVISSVRFQPRTNWGSRMVGGVFQGSNDKSNWTTLYTVSSTPAQGQMTTATVNNSTAFRYVRYMAPQQGYGNVAEVEFYTNGSNGTTTTTTTNTNTNTSSSPLTGTVIGTAGSNMNSGNTIYNVFDGNLNTFFDSPTNAGWMGYDFGSTRYVASVRFAPRYGWGSRMVGGTIQGSNDGVNWSTLYTIYSAPASGQYTAVNLSAPGSYRYVRYNSPNEGYGNIAELQFYSVAASGAEAPVTVVTTPTYGAVDADLTPAFSTTPIADTLGLTSAQDVL